MKRKTEGRTKSNNGNKDIVEEKRRETRGGRQDVAEKRRKKRQKQKQKQKQKQQKKKKKKKKKEHNWGSNIVTTNSDNEVLFSRTCLHAL